MCTFPFGGIWKKNNSNVCMLNLQTCNWSCFTCLYVLQKAGFVAETDCMIIVELIFLTKKILNVPRLRGPASERSDKSVLTSRT